MSRSNMRVSRLSNYFTLLSCRVVHSFFFFQAEDGIRDLIVTGVQTCALPILAVSIVGTPGARPAAVTLRVGGREVGRGLAAPGTTLSMSLPPGGPGWWVGEGIGRASGRGRGEVSGGGGSLKKKKKKGGGETGR